MNPKKKDYFTTKMFFRQLVPSLVATFSLALADMADALVVGQRMGATGLAAVSICLPIFMIINVIMHGFGIGGSVRYATLLAKGENREAGENFQGVMALALSIGVALSILGNLLLTPLLNILGTVPSDGDLFVATGQYAQILVTAIPLFFFSYIAQYYLRNDNAEQVAGWGFTCGTICDVGLNILLVLVLDFGILGAAYATVMGHVVSSTIYIVTLIRRKTPLTTEKFRPNLRDGGDCFKVGAASSFQYLFSMFFILIANRVLMNLSGETGVAVFDLVQNASFLILYLYDATARATQPLISTFHGERNQEAVKSTRRMGILYGSGFGLVMIVAVAVFPDAISTLFGLHEPEAVALAAVALRTFCMGALFAGINTLLISFAQSCSDEKTAFFITMLRGGIVLLPATMVCSLWGIDGFWFLYPITEVVTLAVTIIQEKRSKREYFDLEKTFSRTIHNRVEEMSEVLGEIEGFCERWDATISQHYFVTMTVEELCVAIMQNGFKESDGFIQITLLVLEDGIFELHIRDSAESYNPFTLNSGKAGEDDFDMDAIGVFAIKQKAKSFSYRQYQGFNTLIVHV